MEITRTYFSLGGFQIYWYGVLIGIGVLLAIVTSAHRERLLGLKPDTTLTLALAVVPVGIIGARLYYVLLHLEYYPSLKDALAIRDGGLAIYGGLIFGALAGLIAAKARGQDYIRLCDMAFPCVALAQSLGRWGNFLNREAYGIEIRTRLLKFFPAAVKIGESWQAATFFYESAWCLFIFLFICVLPSRKWFLRRGEGLLGYLTLYAFERCAVEGLRTDSLYIGPTRASQLLSALVISLCCAYLLKRLAAKKPLWAIFALCSLCLIVSASALLPAYLIYTSLPAVFALCVYAWLKTRTEGDPEAQAEE